MFAILSTRTAKAGDPYLEWYTVVTPHFRVTYHNKLGKQAQYVATVLEAVHRRLVPELGWQPKEVTEVLLSDVTDAANGSATALPYNAVRLFVTAPDDMSPLGEYDDWYTELVTHEYTHILHVDNISGIPAIVNAVLGKTSAPNQAQPRWVLEGLAVALETEHTGGGRLRSSQFDMILRADILEGRMAGLDQISSSALRWPTGNLWYLYGGEFIGWIADVYGPDVFAAVATDYGSNIVPWGINRSIRRATGRTYVELYDGWRYHLERQYAAQIAEVLRRGLREGTQLTHRGRIASSPRFVPPCARQGAREEVLYFRDDGDQPSGFYRVPLETRSRAAENDADPGRALEWKGGIVRAELRLRVRLGGSEQAPLLLQRLVPAASRYDEREGTSRLQAALDHGQSGAGARREPDGRHIAYVTNSRGTSALRIADILADGSLDRQRLLVGSAEFEQAYTPRFSPDGKRVAYSSWSAGGYRDIRVVDVKSRRFFEVTHDTALDQQPSWSADGKTLYFTSDRTGIANVYAYDLAQKKLHQVTNVKTGAYMPEVTPDGKTLLYVGYTSYGYDLFSMPLDRSRFLDPVPPPGPRTSPHPRPSPEHWPVEPYNPLVTLRPRAYEVKIGKSTFGNAIRVTTSGSDIVGHHAFAASILAPYDDREDSVPSVSLAYTYRRLPFDFFLSASRSASPRRGYRYGDQEPVFVETFTGVTTGVAFSQLGENDSQAISLSYTAGEFDSKLPVGTRADPYSLVTVDPHRGFLGIIGLGYGYSNADGTSNSIGPERGFSVAANLDLAARETGSDDTLTSVSARVTGYIPMPWLEHHTLALAASGGAAVGTYPRRGYFYTGGFVDSEPSWNTPWQIIDAFDKGTRQTAFVLRGYEPTQFIGTQFNLINAEYRFPIVYPDHGILTLPVFLRAISAAAFADYGGAFNQLDLEDPLASYHLGVGGELWFDLVLGYHVRGIVRFGHARGLDDEAPSGGQTYVVVGSVF